MKAFLCGGGAGIQAAGAYKRLQKVIDHTKPCLYIPLAMEPEQYDSCREWIQDELKDVEVPFIEMVKVQKNWRPKICSISAFFLLAAETPLSC